MSISFQGKVKFYQLAGFKKALRGVLCEWKHLSPIRGPFPGDSGSDSGGSPRL